MGRATDPGENRDPGNDDQLTLARALTKAPRLENSLGGLQTFGSSQHYAESSNIESCLSLRCAMY